jgi:predicted adenine nucleotide alpha hydrolase (AANH) superfamily ATPase
MRKKEGRDCVVAELENVLPDSRFIRLENLREAREIKPPLLLHSCCGPCSTAVVERLGGRFDITIFFYNPNICDREEYDRRRKAQLEFLDQYNDRIHGRDRVSYLEGPYEPETFLAAAKGLEREPEGGRRCAKCFRLRLEKTAETARMSGFDTVGTTLSVSPHKSFALIRKLGMELCVSYGLAFLDEDFKKQGGYQRSVELSREYSLYRQNFCGCQFSKG